MSGNESFDSARDVCRVPLVLIIVTIILIIMEIKIIAMMTFFV